MTKDEYIITTVGDSGVGKTCLLLKYANDTHPSDVVKHTIYSRYPVDVKLGNKNYNVILSDTAEQEELDIIRTYAYKGTNIFLMCYAMDNSESLSNCRDVWNTELRKFVKPKVILVGTKLDLIEDKETAKVLGRDMARQIGAVGFYMTSAMTGECVTEALEQAVRLAIKYNQFCNIL